MKTAKAHRKFAIYSNFLDVILEGEEEIAEGETRKDTLKRILKELEETAAELRKEVLSNLDMVWSKKDLQTSWKDEIPGPLPTISKDFEKLEIAIDNAQTVEELKLIKSNNPLMPASLIGAYNLKMQELLQSIVVATARAKARTDGFDDYCEAHNLPYNNECPECLDRHREFTDGLE